MAAVRPCLLSVAVAWAALAWAPGPIAARADDSDEATYLRYHKAIHAAERCRLDSRFGLPELSRMASYIEAKVNNAISAGRRLSLVEKAKHDVDKLVNGNGCSNDIADLLIVYDLELAPLLAQ
jgi:hypothetical protein